MADGEDDLVREELEVQAEGEEEQQEAGAEAQAEAEPEHDIVFGDEAAPASGERETGLVKHLRDQIRERDKRIASMEQPKIEVGDKPTLESCDLDEEVYEREYEAWRERKAKADQLQTQAQRQSEEVRQEFEKAEQSYRDKRARLPFTEAEIEEREQTTLSALDQVQRAAIIMVAKDAALVFQALGRHPDKLAHISQIKNPVKLAYELAALEGGLKVMPRRQVNQPEEVASGSASVAMKGPDQHLERLEKEADRTGDRTKLVAYKKSLKQAA